MGDLVNLSKTMSWLLRHHLHETDLVVSSDGYVKVNDMLCLPEFKNITLDQVIDIVKTNDKKRFSLKEENGTMYIRANQGHSKDVGKLIKQEELLKEIISPLENCIHGTNLKAWSTIQTEGLSTMDRTHIHFATGLNSKSGFRGGSQILIYIDMKLAMNDGIKFYISDNGVILTNGINNVLPPKYFLKVINTKDVKKVEK